MLDIVVTNDKCMPKAATDGSAGLDLRLGIKTAAGYTVMTPGMELKFSTGVKVAIPKGWVGLLLPRSGLGTKFKVKLDNTVGIIDSDYRGEIKVCMTNTGSKEFTVEDYERVCQLVIVPHMDVSRFNVVNALEETARGEGGFGHTGKS